MKLRIAQNHDFNVVAGYVFDPSGRELAFCENLPEEERDDFLLFIIGYKMSRNQKDPDTWKPIPDRKTIEAWKTADEDDREEYIDDAKRVMDPRLDKKYLKAGTVQEDFVDSLKGENIKRFESFAVGWKICHLRYQTEPLDKIEEKIIKLWSLDDSEKEKRYAAVGTVHINRAIEMTKKGTLQPLPPRETDPDAHYYVSGYLPSPTRSDIGFIRKTKSMTDKPVGSRWKFATTLYQGSNHEVNGRKSQRIVHLFVLVDKQGMIRNRMVVKISGGVTLQSIRKETEAEYNKQAAVSGKGCHHILNAYGSSVRERASGPQLGYIFMEYAPFGSLLDLELAIDENPDIQIPEPLLWLVFKGLVEALYMNHTGIANDKDHEPKDQGRANDDLPKVDPEWRSIINPDIKPANIVLGEALPNHYPAYKTPKMIDYGLAFYGNSKKPKVNLKRTIGTKGWWPPEQAPHPPPIYSSTPIKIHSNIFNVGQIMLCLMEGCDMEVNVQSTEKIVHIDGYHKCYSMLLERTVFHCLELQADSRPTLERLLFLTHEGLKRWEKAYEAVDGEIVPNYAKWEYIDDDLKLGGPVPEHLGGPKKRRAEKEGGEEKRKSKKLS